MNRPTLPEVFVGERTYMRGLLSRTTKFSFVVEGDVGTEEIKGLIRLLLTQVEVLDATSVTKSDESSPKGVQHGLAHREDETGPVPGEGETCPVCERSVIEDGVCARCDYRPESGEGIAP